VETEVITESVQILLSVYNRESCCVTSTVGRGVSRAASLQHEQFYRLATKDGNEFIAMAETAS
jgi:hypothetical protein